MLKFEKRGLLCNIYENAFALFPCFLIFVKMLARMKGGLSLVGRVQVRGLERGFRQHCIPENVSYK